MITSSSLQKQGKGNIFQSLLPHFMRHKWSYIFGFIFMLLQNYSYVKLSETIKFTLAEIISKNRSDEVLRLLGIIFVFLIATCFFMFAMRHLIIGNSRKIEYVIREILFTKLLSLPLKFYRKQQTGDLVSRLTNDLNDLRTLLGPGIMYIPNSLSRIIFFVPVMFSISPLLISITFAQMAILLAIIFIIMPRLRPYYTRIQEARGNINNHAWQMIFGINTIKLNTLEKTQSHFFQKFSHKYLKENLRLEIIEGFTWPFFFFFFSLSQSVILFFGGQEIITGAIQVEELLQFSVMISVMIFPIFALGWVMSILQQGISAWYRMEKILQEPVDDQRVKPLPKSKKRSLDLECKKISLLTPEVKPPNYLLKNISLKIPHGKMIGLTGNTGSGKTLLLEILAGLRLPSRGKILIAGVDLTEIAPKYLYRKLSLSSQESFLFSTTIKKNIGFEGGQEPIQNKVEESARISAIAEDIHGFPNQYDQVLGERGINLSGGQKQRTSLGRAVYKEADILILDDSLSAVDAKTEKRIIDNIRSLKSLKTIIIASHRVSLLKHADEIVFLKNGEIVEKGSPSKLLKKKKGHYSQLVTLQKLKESLS